MTLEERIISYLDRCPPAIEHSGGDVQTFKVACNLYNGFALDEAETFRFLQIYNKTCQPPWKEERLRKKVSGAMSAKHQKPRGHLLGTTAHRRAGAIQGVPNPVPVRLMPKVRHFGKTKNESRTLRTLLFDPTDNMRARTCSISGGAKQPSEASVVETNSGDLRSPEVFLPDDEKGPVSNRTPGRRELTPEDWAELRAIDPPVKVAGCKIPRPSEIDVADEDWHAVERAGFADNPLVQLALVTFGPGCTVVEIGRSTPCE